MAFHDFMNKVRYWDNLTAKWIFRNFYFLFFEIILVVIFFFWFVNSLHVISDIAEMDQRQGPSLIERLLTTQSVSMSILVLLVLFNSFWMLFIFNSLQRSMTLLKDINFTLMRLRTREKPSRPS